MTVPMHPIRSLRVSGITGLLLAALLVGCGEGGPEDGRDIRTLTLYPKGLAWTTNAGLPRPAWDNNNLEEGTLTAVDSQIMMTMESWSWCWVQVQEKPGGWVFDVLDLEGIDYANQEIRLGELFWTPAVLNWNRLRANKGQFSAGTDPYLKNLGANAFYSLSIGDTVQGVVELAHYAGKTWISADEDSIPENISVLTPRKHPTSSPDPAFGYMVLAHEIGHQLRLRHRTWIEPSSPYYPGDLMYPLLRDSRQRFAGGNYQQTPDYESTAPPGADCKVARQWGRSSGMFDS